MGRFRDRVNAEASRHPSERIGLSGYKAIIVLALALRAVWSSPGWTLSKVGESIAVVGRWFTSKPLAQAVAVAVACAAPLVDDITIPSFVVPAVSAPDDTAIGYDSFPTSVPRILVRRKSEWDNNGTGTLISGDRVVTAGHVTAGRDGDIIAVRFSDGVRRKVNRVVEYDDADLAVLYLEPCPYDPSPVSSIRNPDWVCAAGLAGSDTPRLFCGVPSPSGDGLYEFIGEAIPGDSGGGVFAEDGLWGVLVKRAQAGKGHVRTRVVPLSDLQRFLDTLDTISNTALFRRNTVDEGTDNVETVEIKNSLIVYGTEGCRPCTLMKAVVKDLQDAGYDAQYISQKNREYSAYPKLVFSFQDGTSKTITGNISYEKATDILDGESTRLLRPLFGSHKASTVDNMNIWDDYEGWYKEHADFLNAFKFLFSIVFMFIFFI